MHADIKRVGPGIDELISGHTERSAWKGNSVAVMGGVYMNTSAPLLCEHCMGTAINQSIRSKCGSGL